MIPSDPRLQAAVQSAIGTVKKTVAEAAERVVESLGLSSLTSASNKQKQAFNDAQYELRRKLSTLQSVFDESLRESVANELAGRDASGPRNAATDWQSLSLVDDREVEEQVAGDRIAQAIGHECEWELRELAGYMGSLLQRNQAEPRRNPVRPEVLGRALYRGIEAVSDKEEIRSLIAKELGQTVARAMRACYTHMVADLQNRGVQPAGLTVKQTAVSGMGELSAEPETTAPTPVPVPLTPRIDPQRQASRMRDVDRAQLIGRMFGVRPEAGLGEDSTLDGTAEGALNTDYSTDGPYSQGSMPSRHAPGGARQDAGLSARSTLRGPVSGQALNPASFGSPSSRPMPSRFSGNASVLGAQPARAEDAALDAMARHVGQDAHLMALIRRLTEMASRPGELDVGPHSSTGRATGIPSTATPLGNTRTPFGTTTGASTGGAEPSDAPLAGLMAVNLIRAHRDELRQASPGALDHMVIDVVGSLFDQILSDPKVPPQMARQIARLQLPVLRVALSDVGFFSSRRHPVRRFVNRIASLACAFDDFEDGPGRTFLAEVSALVRDIVDGDFDQMAVYEAKLASLEAFIDQQNEQAVEAHGNAASMLGAKEVELRLQQRYTQQLTSALAEVATPEFIREFLAQVWSQAMMTAARQGGGADAALAQRYRQAARNLVTSVQPKGTPSLRKAFLLQLPPLMKDLNAGLDLIGWPAVARKEFFGKLLPLHAESLKGTPPTELQQNLLNKQLESILGVPVPRSEELSRSDTLPVLTDEVVEQKFSKEEVAQLGLVEERSVDWDGLVDIDLGAELEASESTPVDLELDIGTATSPAELPEPSQGPQLMAHVKLGFAYRMHLKGTWTKVRLSYVSPGRAFFVFTHGKKHQETLSMTARMLARMCDTGRLRAFENAYLIERATVRARKQLAALAPAGKH